MGRETFLKKIKKLQGHISKIKLLGPKAKCAIFAGTFHIFKPNIKYKCGSPFFLDFLYPLTPISECLYSLLLAFSLMALHVHVTYHICAL